MNAQAIEYPFEMRHTVRRRPRVLIADDDSDLRRLVVAAFRKEDCETIEVDNGSALLDYLGSWILSPGRCRSPDVIVSDIFMPGFSGLDVLGGLRHGGWSKPVVLMSAFDDFTVRRKAQDLGAAAILHKPFDMKDLKAKVFSLVRC